MGTKLNFGKNANSLIFKAGKILERKIFPSKSIYPQHDDDTKLVQCVTPMLSENQWEKFLYFQGCDGNVDRLSMDELLNFKLPYNGINDSTKVKFIVRHVNNFRMRLLWQFYFPGFFLSIKHLNVSLSFVNCLVFKVEKALTLNFDDWMMHKLEFMSLKMNLRCGNVRGCKTPAYAWNFSHPKNFSDFFFLKKSPSCW